MTKQVQRDRNEYLPSVFKKPIPDMSKYLKDTSSDLTYFLLIFLGLPLRPLSPEGRQAAAGPQNRRIK